VDAQERESGSGGKEKRFFTARQKLMKSSEIMFIFAHFLLAFSHVV
jgi:hypothetical protein